MFNWLKNWMQKPAKHDFDKHAMMRFVSEGGPDVEEAKNSDKREAIFIKAQKYHPKKHAVKKTATRKHAAA
ncbi:hypothetical protein [Aestuariivirga litoralis]|uniref:hypothetical protein n=1 Tax=Aestuariivirga litoralis TaxID=2650924 RepID=UPI0018C509D3|nr:hypothetical protein [Aestuariivirga litoralis]MBG1233085.1 hypothetical protein [Aestuariivirga litoralis]